VGQHFNCKSDLSCTKLLSKQVPNAEVRRVKIAVVGGGISGLSAALILTPHHEVHLFESETTLGGHAHTVSMPSQGRLVHLETGFFVFNPVTYPHFTRLLDYLGVSTIESNMSLSIQTSDRLEWGGANLATIFAQKKNLLNLDFLRMLREILRFSREAEKNLRLSRENHWTLEELVRHRSYSQALLHLFLLPMTGAIWSMSFDEPLRLPAETFLNFCLNHRLLQRSERSNWRTIAGGSINYVERMRARLANPHLGTKVRGIRLRQDKLQVSTEFHESEFDKVILATHAPVSRAILQPAFPDLAAALEPFQVSSNRVELHEDESVMPQNRSCWSSWNVKANEHPRAIELTYYLNKLQSIDSTSNYFITLNSIKNLARVHRIFFYDHPQFDFATMAAQQKLPSLQGRHGIYLAGAWTRYGFHEDGIVSAINVARDLGCEPPWMPFRSEPMAPHPE